MVGRPKRRAKLEAAAEEIRSNLPALIPPPPQPRDRFGRVDTKFKPEFIQQARILCEEGATNAELAEFFQVSESTYHLWRHTHAAFNAVILAGRAPADERVIRSLYELSTGYTKTLKKVMKLRDADGNEKLEEYEEEVHVPANPVASKYWLNNRRPDDWKERTEKHVTGHVEHEHLTVDQARERVIARLSEMKRLSGN